MSKKKVKVEVKVEETVISVLEQLTLDLKQVQDMLNGKPSQEKRRTLLRSQTDLQVTIKNL